MGLKKEEYELYRTVLCKELVPAMGCTEPIAVAYAAACAANVLGEKTAHISIRCSGNIIKNVKGVTVPNSGNQKGIEVAATLGAIGGDPGNALEVLSRVTEEEQQEAKNLVEAGFCDVELEGGVPNLYILATVSSCADPVSGKPHTASVRIEDRHTNITWIERDGQAWPVSGFLNSAGPARPDTKTDDDAEKESEPLIQRAREGDKNPAGQDHAAEAQNLVDSAELPQKPENEVRKYLAGMSLRGLLEYADTVDLEEVRDILEKQIACNTKIAQEGLDNPWGASIGKTILENWGQDVRARACAFAAAGSDARMSGCPLPVVINSGSGNQGITVTMPVLVYAKEWQLSHDKTLRGLIVSNLVSIYIKHYIGELSAFCGAVSAGAAAGAAITYLSGGNYAAISRTITNTLGNVGGIVCDGAKPSCAAKIASSVHAALLAHYMSISDKEFKGGEGFVENDIEETIKNMGYIGKVGMKDTDVEILNVMIDKVDVNTCL